jgi:DNA-binding NtrC family response regulator
MLRRQPCQVICTDYDMPEMNGVDLLRCARALYPGTSGILITGLREKLPAGVSGDESIFAVIYKPYTAAALFRTIHDAAKLTAMTQAASSFQRNSTRLGKK